MVGIVLLWAAAYFSGMLFCKIVGENETSQVWKHLIGFLFLIFCQGCVFFGGQLLGWNFKKTGDVLLLLYVLICCVSILICKEEWKQMVKEIRTFSTVKIAHKRHKALFWWLFLGIVFAVTAKAVLNRSDAMLEMVQTTLMTDTMNQYHPFTKEKLELGVILSKKIITLPFWYSILSLWTGWDALMTVRVAGTVITVLYSFLAFGELGRLLFFNDFKKTWLLLIFMELLYLSGDYCAEAAGYRQLYYGYSGEVIVATVILPCVISMLYRFLGAFLRKDFPKEKERISIFGLVGQMGLCIGCCFFLTSYAWGVVLVVTAIFMCTFSIIVAGLINKKQERRK